MKKNIVYKNDLYACYSKRKLAKLLSNGDLKVYTKEIRNPDHHFLNKKRTFYQSKVTKEIFDKKPTDYISSKYREFSDSCDKHKKVLRQICFYLSQIEMPEYLFSKKESDYKRNALYHIGNTKFILLDINSFFPNCKFKRVKDFFAKESGLHMVKEKKDKDGNIIVYESDVADRMAKIITVPISSSNAGERIIPQGYPTSPIVSFLSYKEMFDKINDVAIKYNCKFSTYVDDISFSYKDNNFNPNDLITEVSNILNDYGHSISEKIIKIIDIEKELGPNEQLILPLITGLTVKRYCVRASKKMHSKMNKLFNIFISMGDPKDELEYIKKWKCFISLNGMFNTIEYVEPPATKKNREHIKKVIDKNKKNFVFHVKIQRVEQLKYERKIFDAYKNGTLTEFVNKNKDKLINYRK